MPPLVASRLPRWRAVSVATKLERGSLSYPRSVVPRSTLLLTLLRECRGAATRTCSARASSPNQEWRGVRPGAMMHNCGAHASERCMERHATIARLTIFGKGWMVSERLAQICFRAAIARAMSLMSATCAAASLIGASTCSYARVCMHVCAHVQGSMLMHICVCACVRVCVYVYVYMYMYVCMPVVPP